MKYRLKKDLPCAKAGEIFRQDFDKNDNSIVYMYQESYGIKQHKICLEDIDNFDEWFEEIKEYYVINSAFGEILKINDNVYSDLQIRNMRELRVLFDIWLEADRKLAYLKAKTIIKQDTKGFKPDWKNPSQKRFFGYYNLIDKKLNYSNAGENMESKIFFKTEEDIRESFKQHLKEWKTYLTYEQ